MTAIPGQGASPPLFLTFRAGGERFGVPLGRVRGAHRPRRIAPLPGAPAVYAGVVLVKGEALGVVCARRALLPGREAVAATGGATCLPVILLFAGDSRALLVDRVDGIEAVDDSTVSPPHWTSRHVSGVVEGTGRRLSLVDVDALLGSQP